MKQTVKYVKDMFLVTSMGPPGGGRTAISRRLQSKFNLINMTFPSVSLEVLPSFRCILVSV